MRTQLSPNLIEDAKITSKAKIDVGWATETATLTTSS